MASEDEHAHLAELAEQSRQIQRLEAEVEKLTAEVEKLTAERMWDADQVAEFLGYTGPGARSNAQRWCSHRGVRKGWRAYAADVMKARQRGQGFRSDLKED